MLLAVLALASSRAGQRPAMTRSRRRPAGPEVPAVRGPWSTIADELERLTTYAHELAGAYAAAGLPTVAVPLAVAHSMFATGAWKHGGPFVWNHNVGVVRAGPTWAGPWVSLSTREVLDDRGTVDPSDDLVQFQRGQAWRAYENLDAGAAAALRVWSRSQRYRRAYLMLLAGDPSWSRALGEAGYYTANPILFERGYRNRLDRVRRLLGASPAPERTT